MALRVSLVLCAVLLMACCAPAAPVTSLAFSPDGSVLAAASGDSVKLHPASGGAPSSTLGSGSGRAVAVAFQPGGTLLAVGGGIPGERGGVRLFDWKLRRRLGSVSTNTDVVTSVAFSPDGKLLAAAGADKSAAVYRIEPDGATLAPVLVLTGHSAAVQAVAFSPDGGVIVTASVDRSLKVWSAKDGSLVRSLGQHTDAVHALAFRPVTPDRADAPAYCASGGDERAARVWQPTIGRMVRIVRGHGGPVLALAFSSDGARLFTAGSEGILRVFDADSDELISTSRVSEDWIHSVAVSPDRAMLAAGDWRGIIHRFDISGGTISRIATRP